MNEVERAKREAIQTAAATKEKMVEVNDFDDAVAFIAVNYSDRINDLNEYQYKIFAACRKYMNDSTPEERKPTK